MENEFGKMKEIIDTVDSEEEIEVQYLKVYNVNENLLNEEDNDNDTNEEIVKELVTRTINEAIDELKEERKKVEMIANEKKVKTKIKGGKNLEEKKNKVEQLQIRNNKNAIENIESLLIEVQENYEKKLNEMDKLIKEMKKKHDEEITEIKKENKMAIKFAENQILVVKKIESEKLMKEEEYVKEVNEKDAQLTMLNEKIHDMEVVIKINKKNIEKEIEYKIVEMKDNIEDNRAKINNTKRKDINDNVKERLKNIERKMERDKTEIERNRKNIVPTRTKDNDNDEKEKEKEEEKEKRVIHGEVIIIMDSNRTHIDKERFWTGHSCKILRAGDVSSARKVISENKFKEAKFIYIHIGTNDIEKMDSVDDMARNIIQVGKLAKESNPNASIMVSEIPIRKDYLNQHRMAVNNLMEKCMPESLFYIKHQNVTKEMLVDKKHISEKYIHNIVRNMKDKLREILRLNQDKTKYGSRPGIDERNLQKEGKRDLNYNVVDIKKKISSLVDYLTKF